MHKLALLLPTAALLVAAPAAATTSPIEGLWTNPKHSMVVRIAPCGTAWCGLVVRANAHEKQKAEGYGMQTLEGQQMLSGLRPSGNGRWKGQVYIPKLGTRVGSTVTMQSANRMSVSGCFAGFLCKAQVWSRVG